MAKKMRLYVVQVGENEHFVRATSQAGAIHTIIKDHAKVRVADTEDVFRLAQKRGVEMTIVQQVKHEGPGRPVAPKPAEPADAAEDTRTLPLDLSEPEQAAA